MRWEGYFGGLNSGQSPDSIITNNIVASTWHTGFMLPAYSCGDTQVNYGNIAHSISGYGVIVQGSKSIRGDCAEFSEFKGYKTRIAVVHMGGGLGYATNKVHSIVAIDSSTGLMAFGYESGHVEVSDALFYGGHNMPNKDCPNNDNCDQCIPKRGLMIPTFAVHATEVIKAPIKLKSMYGPGGSWGGSSLFKDSKFIGYEN